MATVIFVSTSDCRRPPRMFGPWATVPAARNSLMWVKMTRGLCSADLAGGNRTTRNRLIPYCLFIDPELAHVGLTESEAQAEKGISYRLIKQPMSEFLRTRSGFRRLAGSPKR